MFCNPRKYKHNFLPAATEIQQIRALRGCLKFACTLYSLKSKITKNTIQIRVFLQNRKKTKMGIFAFCVIAFEPIKIQTCSAPQNDRLNLSFVKDKTCSWQKMARYGRYMAIYQLLFFGSLSNLHTASGYI